MNEDEFVRKLVEFFTPKVMKSFDEGFPWWQVEEDVNEILDEQAVNRVAGQSRRVRASALRAYRNRIHPKVINALRDVYPKVGAN